MENRITGVMVYYYFVCKRKLWYFSNEIQMEGDNENVQLGKLLDEESYKRDEKHINIDNIINIDFIKDHNELHEIKSLGDIAAATTWLNGYITALKEAKVIDEEQATQLLNILDIASRQQYKLITARQKRGER